MHRNNQMIGQHNHFLQPPSSANACCISTIVCITQLCGLVASSSCCMLFIWLCSIDCLYCTPYWCFHHVHLTGASTMYTLLVLPPCTPYWCFHHVHPITNPSHSLGYIVQLFMMSIPWRSNMFPFIGLHRTAVHDALTMYREVVHVPIMCASSQSSSAVVN